MADLIDRQGLINAIQKAYIDTQEGSDSAAVNINVGLTKALHAVQDLPSAQPEQRWIPCSERLPVVEYDYLGNWNSEEVILLMNDEEYLRVCNGHYNPVGVFEVCEDDGLAFVGRPVEHVAAWMPLPEPYREEGEERCQC